jgi:hypothetical protein
VSDGSVMWLNENYLKEKYIKCSDIPIPTIGPIATVFDGKCIKINIKKRSTKRIS